MAFKLLDPHAIPALTVYEEFSYVRLLAWSFATTQTPLVIVDTILVIVLWAFFVVPFDIARTIYRRRAAHIAGQLGSTPTVFQAVVCSLSRIGMQYLNYKVIRLFFDRSLSLFMARLRIGSPLFEQRCRLVQTPAFSGWYIASPIDLDRVSRADKAYDDCQEKCPVVLFLHGAPGGSVAFGSPEFSLEFLPRLRDAIARCDPSMANCVIFAPHLPLVPESNMSDQKRIVSQVWKALSSHPHLDKNRTALILDCGAADLVPENITASILVYYSPWSVKSHESASLSLSDSDLSHAVCLDDIAILSQGRKSIKTWPASLALLKYLVFGSQSFRQNIEASVTGSKKTESPSHTTPTAIFRGTGEVLRHHIASNFEKFTPERTIYRKQGGFQSWPIASILLGANAQARGEGLIATADIIADMWI